MNNATTHADAIEEQLAAARSTLADDVRNTAIDARTLSDWRHHFRTHPWLFSGAAAAVGFVLTPRQRRRLRAGSAVGSAGVAEAADTKQAAGLSDAMARSRNGLLQASVASIAAALVEEALILGVRRGRELLSHPVADDRAEGPAAGSKQPISRQDGPEVIPNGRIAPLRQDTGTAEFQQAVGHLQRCLKGAMADHPEMSLVAAAATGVVLGWTVKRK